MRRELIIDGNNFNNMAGFYCEVENVFTKNLNWKIGRNLNAFNDVLRGGFGVHEYAEPIKVIWIDFEKSRKDLGYNEYAGKLYADSIVDIIKDNDPGHKDCVLETL